jgi:hypothetical protein
MAVCEARLARSLTHLGKVALRRTLACQSGERQEIENRSDGGGALTSLLSCS